jgi:hypothetical protein
MSASAIIFSIDLKAGLPESAAAGATLATPGSGGGAKAYKRAYTRKMAASTYKPIFNQVSALGAWVILNNAPNNTGTAAADTKMFRILSMGLDFPTEAIIVYFSFT